MDSREAFENARGTRHRREAAAIAHPAPNGEMWVVVFPLARKRGHHARFVGGAAVSANPPIPPPTATPNGVPHPPHPEASPAPNGAATIQEPSKANRVLTAEEFAEEFWRQQAGESEPTSTLEERLRSAQLDGLLENLFRQLTFVSVKPGIVVEFQALHVKSGNRWPANFAAHVTSAAAALELCGSPPRGHVQGLYIIPSRLREGVESRMAVDT